MEGLVCPKLAGFLRLTQRLKAKIQGKSEDDKARCPICGCKSSKGNLCQDCFVRSFRPIAYTRNIKVVEQNEIFYRPGKERRWRRKKRSGVASRKTDVKEDVVIMPAFTNALESTDNSGIGTDEEINASPDISNQNVKVSSSELVKIDLVDLNNTNQPECMEALPKYVPDFWESPPEDVSVASKLKTLSVHVFQEAKRPFKEIFCDSTTDDVIAFNDQPDDVNSPHHETVQERPHSAQSDCCQNRLDKDHMVFSKQLKQNAILELLKVAFKTNMILNNLFKYFKKVVESDGSNSETSEVDRHPLGDHSDADSKISVDSFFFPNRQSAIRWGADAEKTQPEHIIPLHDSETEVISKSQATLRMLNQTWSEVSWKDEVMDVGDLGTFPGSISASDCSTDRLLMRKFRSEHSKLRLKDPDDKNKDSCNCWESESLVESSRTPESNLASAEKDHSGKSLLDLVFGLNRTYIKPSLLPLPDCQQDLIALDSPDPSQYDILDQKDRKDADSQTAVSSRHLEREMGLLHEAFLDQLTHFSVQLVESCKTFGHSWQTSFLAELVDHFHKACNIISCFVRELQCGIAPGRIDELQDVSDQISISLAKLRTHPHTFVGDCSDHDISTLLSFPPEQTEPHQTNTWV